MHAVGLAGFRSLACCFGRGAPLGRVLCRDTVPGETGRVQRTVDIGRTGRWWRRDRTHPVARLHVLLVVEAHEVVLCRWQWLLAKHPVEHDQANEYVHVCHWSVGNGRDIG